MTREQAIDLAVRRHIRMVGASIAEIRVVSRNGAGTPCQQSIDAIRAHFRAICKTYGVVA